MSTTAWVALFDTFKVLFEVHMHLAGNAAGKICELFRSPSSYGECLAVNNTCNYILHHIPHLSGYRLCVIDRISLSDPLRLNAQIAPLNPGLGSYGYICVA